MACDFQLPRDAPIFTETVFYRCHALISTGIWSGIHVNRLRGWIKNFDGPLERYFAACLLDSLLYRSNQQIISLIGELFSRSLVDLTRLYATPNGAVTDWLGLLCRDAPVDPGIRLVAVRQSADPLTKSTATILRLMKRKFRIDERWMIEPAHIKDNISAGVCVFVFVDDFVGTGNQFCELIEDEQLHSLLNSAYFAYAPLAAHEVGLNTIAAKYPQIHIATVEALGAANELFSDNSGCFDDGNNAPSSAREFYYSLLQNRGINIKGPNRRGYGHLEIAYAFEHACPDNCIPILWWDQDGWQPLFDR